MVIFQGSTTACTQLVLVQSNICSFFFRSDCLLFFGSIFFFFRESFVRCTRKRRKISRFMKILRKSMRIPARARIHILHAHPASCEVPEGEPDCSGWRLLCLLATLHARGCSSYENGWRLKTYTRKTSKRQTQGLLHLGWSSEVHQLLREHYALVESRW